MADMTPTGVASLSFYEIREQSGEKVRDVLLHIIAAAGTAEELGFRATIHEYRDSFGNVCGFQVDARPTEPGGGP